MRMLKARLTMVRCVDRMVGSWMAAVDRLPPLEGYDVSGSESIG
jgi:hypothetical protein